MDSDDRSGIAVADTACRGDKPAGYVFGRPTKYHPDMCEKVIEWGRQGKSRTWIAGELGLDRRTLYRWEADHPDFCLALARAKVLEQQWWEDAGQDGMLKQGFGQSVWSRSMAARFPDDWRESTKNETELTGKGGGPLQVTTLLSRLAGRPVFPGDRKTESDGDA